MFLGFKHVEIRVSPINEIKNTTYIRLLDGVFEVQVLDAIDDRRLDGGRLLRFGRLRNHNCVFYYLFIIEKVKAETNLRN